MIFSSIFLLNCVTCFFLQEEKFLERCINPIIINIVFCFAHNYFQAVLRSNQGAVDTTIDQLLSMSTDNENEKIRSELEQKEVPAAVAVKATKSDASNKSKTIQKWNPPLLGPLPENFLRIPQQFTEASEEYTLDNSLLEDERIAMFLQNEEFMAELRWNEDFLSTLENG